MKKKKKGKNVYAAISLVSSIFPIVGGITGAISWWNSISDTSEPEREAAELERENFLYDRDELKSSIEYALDLLPDCDMAANDIDQINDELQRSMNILELNNDLETSRSIYENVSADLVNCTRPLEPPVEISPPALPDLAPITNVPADRGILWFILLVPGPVIVSVTFGIKWYRSREEVDVSDESKSMNL